MLFDCVNCYYFFLSSLDSAITKGKKCTTLCIQVHIMLMAESVHKGCESFKFWGAYINISLSELWQDYAGTFKENMSG